MKLQDKRGLTLVEILIAMAVFSIFIAAFYSTTLAIGKLILNADGKLQINEDIRSFTNDLSQTGHAASAFYIHPSYPKRDPLDPTKSESETIISLANSVGDGGAGDFLILAFYEYASGPTVTQINNTNTYITRVVGFVRKYSGGDKVDQDANAAPVVRFELSPPTPTTWNIQSFTVHGIVQAAIRDGVIDSISEDVVELARGKVNGRLFYRYGNDRFIVNGEIYHRENPFIERRVSNTYNFTVTPRG